MIDPVALLADLKKRVSALETDLRERATDPEGKFHGTLTAEWGRARAKGRTAATYESWLEGRVTQSAVAWVLGTVFLRFCEDNGLIDLPWLAGPGERLDIARERQQAFFEDPAHAADTDREWIVDGFRALGQASPVAGGLFDRAHNPMWQVTPSLEAAKKLIAFWREQKDGEEAALVHDFTDPGWNTRFLGDLYQDLSEHAKKTYALLQTPEFVEEFILDLTLDPALDEFGLDPEPPAASPAHLDLPRGLRLIDPTCGSGHFLLGAFHRLLARWERQAPGAERWELISRVLYSVHGVDKNPFAVLIARFRLMIAAMRAGGVERLAEAPEFIVNIAIGDSLMHGRGAPAPDQGEMDFWAEDESDESKVFTYATEDVSEYVKTVDLLGIGSYHVVVGNPPYITPKDKAENEYYRVYKSSSGLYALSVPFAERFFQLAIRGGQDREGAGHVGQITANSFMKREFGKKLIVEFFPTIELTHIIDTSGAYIPGHGTPTIILIGRRTWPRTDMIRAALGIRGELNQPKNAEDGLVWNAIVQQVKNPGDSESGWISITQMERKNFGSHPWSLSGGGAYELSQAIEGSATRTLQSAITRIGFYGDTHADEAFSFPASGRLAQIADHLHAKKSHRGDHIRDWGAKDSDFLIFPYNEKKQLIRQESLNPELLKLLWPLRTSLWLRGTFNGTYLSDGRTWYEWHQLPSDETSEIAAIAFAFVATHNHFFIDRDGRVFNRSAPVIKLPKGATESDHIALQGTLNSSTACFWLKQVSQDKGNRGGERSTGRYAWESYYEFTSTKLQKFPLANKLPLETGKKLDALAQRLVDVQPTKICANGVPTREQLDSAFMECIHLQGQMIALQEELDWEVYQLYGFLSESEAVELRADPENIPDLKLGERAFELMIAPSAERDEAVAQWFVRHRSHPVSEIPAWPEEYRRVVKKRIETIERLSRTIGLIERPEYKRRWEWEPWEKKEKVALRNWLLDRCENQELWFTSDETGVMQPRTITVNRLADHLRKDANFVSVVELYAGKDIDLSAILVEILDTEHVPYLSALRYKEAGLRIRAQWESVWELQRDEDSTQKKLDIPVPDKYKGADFIKQSYWSNRGKFDVPKERFISYLGGSTDGDESLLLGWAGWNHREQAHALMMLIEQRTTSDGWGRERLTPLIAGLAEVMPWVKQWHGEIDPLFGQSPAQAYEAYLEAQKQRHGLTDDDLKAWRLPKRTSRRPQDKKTK
ncbi:BREX-2 system adenine-specific DNA-methyltransferase PglX [Actinomadura craniellae]|uniref:site-specific DNA-methyltransferase (adenine-specific) n=1 Tax=Actinomadura craniellae TaxID=2231787 RepID=A0A365HCE7_9ACTN|nr:BREX-2 system adenine-specific DNA-methyltransferase PglX [Actinomadura craniellae]RAY15943.1 BREX-2 system adenine-specific DNA-methyltransferase PglX [Actinomadura craniellae]